ncbi:MAG TPA: UDP-N-acetylglucosamine 2-epimerase (non-hydrolyzing) [Bryobacteraceae bacterium]|nr:UDP-N-acetylglucosamine 2-epimerase (non-hydrolyzing) [Bryobacteraceae bacterium]
MIRVLFIFGTRPEAIKLCPIVLHMRQRREVFDVRVCVTAQHRAMLDQVLATFQVKADHDLDIMLPGQTLFQSSSRMLAALGPVLEDAKPDMVLVQGDTTTTLFGALAAFYLQIPVGHVEAGLRTGDMSQPFPEEMNRVLTGRLAGLHFAATDRAAQNLSSEGVGKPSVVITGNSGIDAVLYVRDGLERKELASCLHIPQLDPGRRLIVVTAHRRESFGEAFEDICRALGTLAEREDLQIVFPVHPNPNVQGPVKRHLSSHPNVLLIEPLDYLPFVDLMRRAYILLTDSGGIQEEGPSLGKPVLVMREKTERPEAVEAGTAILVGTSPAKIIRETTRLLDNPADYERMARTHNPYGDGHASERITSAIEAYFSR